MSQRQYQDFEVSQQEKKSQTTRIVDRRGNDIKLSDRQKNEIYRKARDMKERLRDGMCTKNECWAPTDRNVNKMLKGEFKLAPQVELYKKSMQVIGADPKDISTERLRRR